MDIQEMWKTPHLSHSSISNYLGCSLQYLLRKVLKIPPAHVPDNLVFGSTIHFILSLFNQSRKVGSNLELSDLLNEFEDQWAATIRKTDNLKYTKNNTFESLLAQGKGLLKTYFNSWVDEGFRVLSIEQPFRYKIPELPVPLIGITDLVEEDKDGTIIITDYKTSARRYTDQQVNASEQLTLYYSALKNSEFKDREILLRFICLIKTRTPQIQQYWTVRSEIDEQRLKRTALAVWEGIQKEVFIPNYGNWRCDFCAYQESCLEWSQGDLKVAHG